MAINRLGLNGRSTAASTDWWLCEVGEGEGVVMQRKRRGGRRPAGSEQQVNSAGRASHRKLKVMYVWHADGRGEGDGDGDGAGKQAGNL